MPSRLKNLGNAFLLRVRRQRGGQLHQLRETEDRIERATKLMAHAGKEIRFREVGFLRGGLGARQLDVRFLERLLVAFALRDVPRDSQYALQPVSACAQQRRCTCWRRSLSFRGRPGRLRDPNPGAPQGDFLPSLTGLRSEERRVEKECR